MNKSVLIILLIIAVAIIGYFMMQDSTPATDPSNQGDTMMEGEVMDDDGSMVGGDAMADGDVMLDAESQ